MNLNEDINRIKEVMGINENRDMFFKRRRKEFIDAILQSYEWIDVGEAGSFQEYLEEVLMHAIDGFFDYNNILIKNDEMEELLPKALRILQDDEWLFKKIKYHYYSAEDSSMNESKEIIRLKRRMDALIDYVEASYDWLSPRRFKNFDDFLERVIFSATRDFVVDEIGGEYEEQLKISEELEPMIMELVKKHPIYDEIYDHYISYI